MVVQRKFDMADVDMSKIPPERRQAVCTDVMQQHYYSFDVEVGEHVRRLRIESSYVGDVRVANVTAESMAVRRLPRHLRQDEGEYFMLPIVSGGAIALRQNNRSTTIDSSSVAFVGSGEPYFYEHRHSHCVQTLRIPADALRARLPTADWSTSVRFDVISRPMTPMFLAFARALCSNGSRLPESATRSASESLLDLLALTVHGADTQTSDTVTRQTHRLRAMHVVESRFRDPQFNITALASELSLSPRYLQKIFAASGETVSDIIRNRRIAEARRLLAKRLSTGASVASVASAVGFYDAAYFARVFRKQTGVAPNAYAPSSREIRPSRSAATAVPQQQPNIVGAHTA